MSLIRIILIVFIVFVLSRVHARYRRNEISFREWLVWTVFWSVVTVATFIPHGLDFIAKKVGLATGRGVDLAVYISVPVIFYLIFKIIAKLDKIEQNQTKIVRHLSMDKFISKDIKDKDADE